MKPNSKVRILVILLSVLVLGLSITIITDLFAKSNTSPANYVYSSDNVLYFHAPLVSVTQSKERGFPFTSTTKVIQKYTDEGIIQGKTWLQLPSVSSKGSNSFARILISWQFYVDVLVWMIIWLLIGYSIKSINHKIKLNR